MPLLVVVTRRIFTREDNIFVALYKMTFVIPG